MSENSYWTHWSWWTLCNNPCDSGTRTRTRLCVPNSGAKYGGTNNCTNLSDEIQACAETIQPGICHWS